MAGRPETRRSTGMAAPSATIRRPPSLNRPPTAANWAMIRLNDAVKMRGALINGGALVVTSANDALLASGDTFKLFDAASYHGSFERVVLPALSAGLAWNANSLNSRGAISVIAVNPPVISSVTLMGAGLVIGGNGGVPNATYWL